ncbi:MAG: GcvT family protein [Alphaproteobacteria bacterium]|nr:GcvT family protein [Alphaproteobacteria bacterium]
MTAPLPDRADVVIVGGGIVGVSIAYHLTKRGVRDVLLLERKQLTCGTTWHAAGLVGQLRATLNLTRLAQYTAQLYKGLEAETGQATGFLQRGSVAITDNDERLHELKRGASMAGSFGLEAHIVGPAEIQKMWPLLNMKGIKGGVVLPSDGQTNPIDTTQALAKGARNGGAKIVEGVKVTRILAEGGRAVGVATGSGEVRAKTVVLAAGLWTRDLAAAAGVSVPLHACEHFYVVTEAIPGLSPQTPVLRDPDNCVYVKEDAGKLLVGCFEPNAKPIGMERIAEDFAFGELPEDIDHFTPVLERAMERIPVLQKTGMRKFFNGPESFTPDVRYLVGEAPDMKDLFVAAGFNSIGIQSAGGAGKVIADWIVDRRAPMDLWDVDIRRMAPFQRNRRYLKDRVSESLGLLYAMHWPHRQPVTSRPVRTSPLHERMAAAGACFGETAGWERANWFAPKGVKPEYGYSWFRQNWFPHAQAEHMAVRERVGLFDQSSFGKFLLQGRDAESVMGRLCCNDVAVAPGRVVYTQWLNEHGGIEADLTVTRLAEDAYMIVTAAATQRRDFHWAKDRIPADAHAVLTDVTSAYATINLQGPRARDLLQRLSPDDLSNAGFPFGTSREIELAMALVRATRISYVGELGWELYVPTEFARGVYDALVDAGRDLGLAHCGYHALNTLRSEKAYRHWGHDIGPEDTPWQSGLGFCVKLDKKGGFIGREALAKAKPAPLTRRLVSFKLADEQPLLIHDEPIWRDGKRAGRICSGAYGYALGSAVGMGYVEHAGGVTPDLVAGSTFEIEIAGERFAAAASLKPFYDPAGQRVKA